MKVGYGGIVTFFCYPCAGLGINLMAVRLLYPHEIASNFVIPA